MQRSEYFLSLVDSHVEKFKSALEENPNLINEQDENGKTILHHVVRNGTYACYPTMYNHLDAIFSFPHLDISIKDNEDNTALHIAARNCITRQMVSYVFPFLVEEAYKRNFDFSTKGQDSRTILHLAAVVSYLNPVTHVRVNNIKNVLDNAPGIKLDDLTASGATALFYAANHGNFAEAISLLEAGANPSVYGSENRSPYATVNERINALNEMLVDNEIDNHEREKICYVISQYHELKKRMMAINKEMKPETSAAAATSRWASLFTTSTWANLFTRSTWANLFNSENVVSSAPEDLSPQSHKI